MDALLVAALALSAFVLLATERVRADLAAMLVLAALILLRLVGLDQALAGFASPATVTVAALFVISGGLKASGLLSWLGERLVSHGPKLAGFVAAPLSAFVGNTTVVAGLLPSVVRAGPALGRGQGQLMMPLSFFAMLGGTCTLIGAVSHIIVSSVAEAHGLEPFGMFELAGVGLVLVVAGAAYVLVAGKRALPERATLDTTSEFALNRYLSEVVVVEGSPLIGQSLYQAQLGERYGLEVFGHTRDHVMRSVPPGYETLAEGDILAVRAPVEVLMRLGPTAGLAVRSGRHPDVASLRSTESVLVEAVITPSSDLRGRSLKDVNFRQRYGATTLAIRRGVDVREKIGRMPLRVGDQLLIVTPKRNLAQLEQQDSFVILQELELPRLDPLRALTACLILAGVVAAAATGGYPLALAALLGAVLIPATGCLSPRRAYQEIDWTVVFLLAGLIPLGLALEQSGAAHAGAAWLVGKIGRFGPHLALGLLTVVATVVGGFISNAAAAVLLSPLAIAAAQGLGVDPRPFLVGLSFAASCAFWAPAGHATNLLVRGPGGYRFGDYVRAGGPLALLCAVLATLLIPVLFPFG